jgi:FkbM family methyltransferase
MKLLKNIQYKASFFNLIYSKIQNSIDDKKRAGFYKSLIGSSSCLVYDIGANYGNRTKIFSEIGYNVIAVEPQKRCVEYLKKQFCKHKNIEVIDCAVGLRNETRIMYESKNTLLSTLSEKFINNTTGSGRFDGMTWVTKSEVKVITLNDLISMKGIPKFIKIDVEGYEYEVVNTLNCTIDLISLEYTPEMKSSIFAAINHIARLGNYSFNISWYESMKLSHKNWFNLLKLDEIMNALEEDKQIFGDIYLKLNK